MTTPAEQELEQALTKAWLVMISNDREYMLGNADTAESALRAAIDRVRAEDKATIERLRALSEAALAYIDSHKPYTDVNTLREERETWDKLVALRATASGAGGER